MKPLFRWLVTLLTLVSFCRTGAAQTLTDRKISLSPAMVINESARGDSGRLVDEQELSGDPLTGQGGSPKNSWSVGWQGADLYYPLTATIDLGALHHLSEIFIYDSNDHGPLRIETGTPLQWQPLVTDPLTNYNAWNRHTVDVKTRFLHVIVSDPSTVAPEVIVYGRALQPIQLSNSPVPMVHRFSKLGDLIGTNAFIDDPLEKMQAVGFIREYHSWQWDAGDGKSDVAYPNNAYAFNPSSAAGGNAWFFDDYYAKLKKAGIVVSPCLQGSVNWLFPAGAKPNRTMADGGQDLTLPASYRAHADYMFQFAARYGSVKVADAKLRLAPGQPRRSGMGSLRYFENSNEPDAWWDGRGSYSTPTELAARTSADYDGDQKKMGTNFGVKNADPSAKLVLGGLAGLNLDYLKAMKAWADWHRAGDFPADVLNFHHYSNDGNASGQGQIGISPEADHLEERLKTLSGYRDRYLPNKELWLTEFGYDTNPGSPQRAPAIGTTSAEEVQARWILRSYLACAAAGVDRAAQFMLRDDDPQNSSQYSSSGLVSPKGEWNPKPAWLYTYTLKNQLGAMRFNAEIPSGNPKVKVFEFKADSGKMAYVVWCPTADNSVVPGFHLSKLKGKSARLVEFVRGQTEGKTTSLPLVNGAVTVDASELPVIILLD